MMKAGCGDDGDRKYVGAIGWCWGLIAGLSVGWGRGVLVGGPGMCRVVFFFVFGFWRV